MEDNKENFQIKSRASFKNLVKKFEKKLLGLKRIQMVDGGVRTKRLDRLGIDLESRELTTGWCQPVT